MDFVVETSQLRKSFSSRDVLRGLDLQIPPGAIVGLIGANGAGKSTLIKCLLGLLRPDAGTSRVLGEDSWTLSAAAKARLGYVPQQVKLYPWMKVWHMVEYTGSFYPQWDHALTERLLQDWQLRRTDPVSTLSGGELQKLGLILALGHRPDLLVLDEPAAALDPAARREFLRTLVEPVIDGQTTLFSTHILSDLERVATHVAILHEGRIVYHDQLDQLKEHVKRLRITAGADLPPSFAVAGALRTEVSGRSALVAVPHASEALLAELKSRWHAEVDVEPLSLEDIFLELHDGSAKSRAAAR